MTKPFTDDEDFSDLIHKVLEARKTAIAKPDWLKLHGRVESPRYGGGTIETLMGSFVRVQFDTLHEPTEYDWQEAVKAGGLTAPKTSQTQLNLDQIEDPVYRRLAEQWRRSIGCVQVEPPKAAITLPIPEALPEPLQTALAKQGITELYSHQVIAYEAVSAGRDICLATGVNSGKTLAFTLPVLTGALQHGHTTLMIVPTNQLMDDQFDKMCRFLHSIDSEPENELVCGKIHGGVGYRDRLEMLRDQPSVVMINPDCLNPLLGRHRRAEYSGLRAFLKHLKYIVLDECHEVTGVMGAHVALMLMRLRLAVQHAGGDPWLLQYIACSGTVGNPAELVDLLTQRQHPYSREPVQVIGESENGAAFPGRVSLIIKPDYGTSSMVTRLAETLLTETNLVSILFLNSRNGSKHLAGLINRALKRGGNNHLAPKVKVFNSSVDPALKRQTIQGIQDGSVSLVLSTSSLEAGVDLPELDVSIVYGFPRLSSLRQRWGRAGRGTTPGLCIFVPTTNSSMDYYYARHPTEIFTAAIEAALLDPHYPVRLIQHLRAAASESKLRLDEVKLFFGESAEALVGEMIASKKLTLTWDGEAVFALGDAHNIAVRSNHPDMLKLLHANTGVQLESISFHHGIREAYNGGIYSVQDSKGELKQFRSNGVNLEERTATLTPISTGSRFTKALEDFLIIPKREIASKVLSLGTFGKLTLRLDWSEVQTSIFGYEEWDTTLVVSCETSQCKRKGVDVQSNKINRCPECQQALKVKRHNRERLSQTEFPETEKLTYSIQCPTLTLTPNEGFQLGMQNWVDNEVQQLRIQRQAPMATVLQSSDAIGLGVHSLMHQFMSGLPFSDRYSTQDVNDVLQTEDMMQCVLMDTAHFGTGACEFLYEHLNTVAFNSHNLTIDCECKTGCPRCQTHSACLCGNEALHKGLGISLLEAVLAQSSSPTT